MKMFLNTEYKKAEDTKYLCSNFMIYYTRNELDIGKHSTANNESFDRAQFVTSISQQDFLKLLIKTKSFKLSGSKIKCERLIKNNKLTYNIPIMGYFFAEIDCESREINKITNEFEFDKNKNEKFKEEVKQIANFIKENVFINHKPDDMTMAQQLISPLNEKEDYKRWMEYVQDRNLSKQDLNIIHNTNLNQTNPSILANHFILELKLTPFESTLTKKLTPENIKTITKDKNGYLITFCRAGRPAYYQNSLKYEEKIQYAKNLNSEEREKFWTSEEKNKYNGLKVFTILNDKDFIEWAEENFLKEQRVENTESIVFQKE